MADLIKLEQVSKIYNPGENEVRALDEVSLTIRQGEFVAVVGASGSGKSTMMNLLGCLDVPTAGRYLLEGQDVSQMTDRQLSIIRNQTIGFIFQGFNLIPGLTALENVELPLFYRGVPKLQRRALCQEALIQVGLEGRLHHRPAEMSGGQQQRVAIARAIAAKPPLLLADEPTGNLDSRAGEGVMEILRQLSADGRTVIVITHDNGVAAQAARRILVGDGKVLSDASGEGGQLPA